MSKYRVLGCAVLVASSLQWGAVAQIAAPAGYPQGSTWSSAAMAGPVRPGVAHPIISGIVPAPRKKVPAVQKRVWPFSRFAIATKASTLGLGAQIATPISRRLGLRGGVSLLNFGYGAGIDGVNYGSQVHLKNGQASLDFFLFKGSSFHISPGVVIFKSALSASMNVPAGNTFSLGNTNYVSSPSDPVTGTASIAFGRSVMPALTLGFGNMITREHKHWSLPIEIGAAYTGHYTAQLNLQGTTCVGAVCTSTAQIQSSVVQEQNQLNEAMKRYQLYPIVTTGLSYRF